MSQYRDDSTPTLATEVEENQLLRHLNKITRRSERTMEEDEIIRRGYYKVLHRVINSMSTMDHRDSMDRLHLKRCVLYVSSRLCEYWNCGVPVVTSYHKDAEIRLISSQGKLLLYNCLVLFEGYDLIFSFLFICVRFPLGSGIPRHVDDAAQSNARERSPDPRARYRFEFCWSG